MADQPSGGPVTNPHSWADMDLAALQHNLRAARSAAPRATLCAVVKANAYGHGTAPAVKALQAAMTAGDQFAVVTLAEALALQQVVGATQRPVLAMRGALDQQEMTQLLAAGIEFVIHSEWQLALLKRSLVEGVSTPDASLRVWIKVNTGMNRLGLPLQDVPRVWHELATLAEQHGLICHRTLMSHLATSDDLAGPLTARQRERLEALRGQLSLTSRDRISLAASAGILAWPETHCSVVRPGIMLYGASPLLGRTGEQEGLRPVMNLKSRLIALNQVEAGDSIGYGATYQSQQEMKVGIIGIGYGDGYPRHAPTGTPVLVHARGRQVHEQTLVGRVSMDMLAVDLTGVDAQVGDEVLLWGQAWGAQLPAERIADLCQTITYELFCQVTARVQFHYR